MEVTLQTALHSSSKHSLKHKHAGCESCNKNSLLSPSKSGSKLTPRSSELDKPSLKSHKVLKENVPPFKQNDTENISPSKSKHSKHLSECSSCGKQIFEDKLQFHMKSCTSEPVKLAKKLIEKRRTKTEEPKFKENILETETAERTQIPQMMTVACHKCNKQFTLQNIQKHIKECKIKENAEEEQKGKIAKTIELNEKKPLRDIINKLEKKTCPYCKNQIDTDMYNTHIVTCKDIPTDLIHTTEQVLTKTDFSTQTQEKPKPKVVHHKEASELKSSEVSKQDQLQRELRHSLPSSTSQEQLIEKDKLSSERKKKTDKTLEQTPQEQVNKIKTTFFRTSKLPKEEETTKKNALSQSVIVPRLQFCHMCGEKYIPKAQFCAYCGVRKHN